MDQKELDSRFRVVSLLWASLLGGVTLFAGLAWALARGLLGPPPSPSLPPGVAAKLLILSALLMVAGIVYRNGDVGAHADPGPWLASYQTRIVVALALAEAGALLGLVLSILSGRPGWVAGVWGAAVLAMAFSRPHRDDLERMPR